MSVLLLAQDETSGVTLEDLPAEAQALLMQALHDTMRTELLARCPWRDLPLSARASNMLERNQINTVKELLRYTPTRLKEVPGCGRNTCLEIQLALEALGLSLRKEEQET